jgi:hypothetical protein
MIEYYTLLELMGLSPSGGKETLRPRIRNGLEENGHKVIVDILVVSTKKLQNHYLLLVLKVESLSSDRSGFRKMFKKCLQLEVLS